MISEQDLNNENTNRHANIEKDSSTVLRQRTVGKTSERGKISLPKGRAKYTQVT